MFLGSLLTILGARSRYGAEGLGLGLVLLGWYPRWEGREGGREEGREEGREGGREEGIGMRERSFFWTVGLRMVGFVLVVLGMLR